VSKVQVDPTAFKAAIKTAEYPHSTTCFVRRVTDTHVEACFRIEVNNEWVMLPLAEITSFDILRQVKMTSGVYSLVKLGLQDEHPTTEIEALRAQVRFMRDNPRSPCGCQGDFLALPSAERRPFYDCLKLCENLTGSAYWNCMWDCLWSSAAIRAKP
jgi:hypothetical protein